MIVVRRVDQLKVGDVIWVGLSYGKVLTAGVAEIAEPRNGYQYRLTLTVPHPDVELPGDELVPLLLR